MSSGKALANSLINFEASCSDDSHEEKEADYAYSHDKGTGIGLYGSK